MEQSKLIRLCRFYWNRVPVSVQNQIAFGYSLDILTVKKTYYLSSTFCRVETTAYPWELAKIFFIFMSEDTSSPLRTRSFHRKLSRMKSSCVVKVIWNNWNREMPWITCDVDFLDVTMWWIKSTWPEVWRSYSSGQKFCCQQQTSIASHSSSI